MRQHTFSHQLAGCCCATCEDSGKLFEICSRCGEVKATDTPKGEHSYKTYSVAATCTAPGYTVKECTVCGDRQITDVTSALPHDYKAAVTPASCETGGSTLHLCAGCGSSFVTDYTDALGHSWDNGSTVTDATGHKLGDWITDKEPTTDSEGSRHFRPSAGR